MQEPALIIKAVRNFRDALMQHRAVMERENRVCIVDEIDDLIRSCEFEVIYLEECTLNGEEAHP